MGGIEWGIGESRSRPGAYWREEVVPFSESDLCLMLSPSGARQHVICLLSLAKELTQVQGDPHSHSLLWSPWSHLISTSPLGYAELESRKMGVGS